MKLKQVTLEKLEGFKRIVEEDFPNDAMLQEVHLARLILHEEMSELTREQRLEYFRQARTRRSDAA